MPPNRQKSSSPWRLAAGLTLLGLLFLGIAVITFMETAKERSQLAPLAEDNRLLREDLARVQGLLDQANSTLEEKAGQLETNTTALQKAREARLELEKEKMNRLTAAQEKAEQVQRIRERVADIPVLEASATFIQGDALVIRLPNKVLFAPAESSIQEEGKTLLSTIADALASEFDQLTLRIEGHTDDVPIGEALQNQYPSNWHLSAARAASAAMLIEEAGWTEPERIEVVGRGPSAPIASNETDEGRALNRRIDLVIGMAPDSPDQP